MDRNGDFSFVDRDWGDWADGDGMAEITTFLFGLGAGAGVAGLVAVLLTQAAKNRDMERRVSKLEEASRKRIPYGVAEEVMDAMAALDKFVFEKEFYDGIVDNVRGHLANALKTGTKEEK